MKFIVQSQEEYSRPR